MFQHLPKHFIVLPIVCVLSLLSACSTLKESDAVALSSTSDPLSGVNRSIYAFNDGLDRAILKPVAEGYTTVVPEPARSGVSNFFSNLFEPLNIANNLLQGKFDRALSSTYRFVVNSTVGVAGLIDVADLHEVEETPEDFGQTLAVWGVGSGPYLMMPFFGPSNLRDGIARITSGFVYYPISEISDDSGVDLGLTILSTVDARAGLLGADEVLEQQGKEYKYDFLKTAYDQNRLNQIYDGKAPETEEDYEF
ncbi:MAG: VacJ family lipoprotein [Pseudomonadota bacterium]